MTTRRITRAALITVASAALVATASAPALAVPDASDTTALTATIGSGSLSISSQASVAFAAFTPSVYNGDGYENESFSTLVTDNRAGTSGYTVSWSVTDFTTSPSNGKPIAANRLTVTPMPANDTSGTVTWTAGSASSSGSGVLGTASNVSGVNAIALSTDLELRMPESALAGEYGAVLTVSVTGG